MRMFQYFKRIFLAACLLTGLFACSATASAALTAEQAEVYSDILWNQLREHDRGVFSQLIDFDQNGVEELFSITTAWGKNSRTFDFKVWGIRNGKIELLGSGEALLGTSIVRFSLKNESGKTYLLVDEDHGLQGRFILLYSIQPDGTWGKEKGIWCDIIIDDKDKTTYSYNSYPEMRSITEKEYNRLAEQYRSNAKHFMTLTSYNYFNFDLGAKVDSEPPILEPGYENAWEETANTLQQLASQTPAQRSVMKAKVNGVDKQFESYLVNGNNYLKLRDIAYVLNGTDKQFSVAWDQANQLISLKSKTAYQAVGGELALPTQTGATTILKNTVGIRLDGRAFSAQSYNAQGNNYFKLRDIADAVQFEVAWNEQTKTVQISTEKASTQQSASKADLVMLDAETAAGAAQSAESKHVQLWKSKYPDKTLGGAITADFDEDGVYETFIYTDNVEGKNLFFVRGEEILALEGTGWIEGFSLLKSESNHYTHLISWPQPGVTGSGQQDLYSVKNGQPIWEKPEMLANEDEAFTRKYHAENGYLLKHLSLRIDSDKTPWGFEWDEYQTYYTWDSTQQKYVEVK